MPGRVIFILAVALNSGTILLCSFQYGPVNWLSMLMTIHLLVVIFLQRHATKNLSTLLHAAALENGNGNVESALKLYIEKSKANLTETKKALSYINEIGQDTFLEMLSQIKDSEIRESLQLAHTKVASLRKKEKESNWITEGIAAFTELKHKGNDITEFSASTISTIVKYLNANQGGFFLLKTQNNDKWFELVASYAYGKRKYHQKRVTVGEGLLGQLYYEREIIYLTDVPKDYIKITSGLGEALPRCICIVPLIFEGAIHGAIEIASFQEIQLYEKEYLKKIADSLGYTLASLESNNRTEILLKESQQMAEEVKSQEEELRQNMVELTAAQEQMSRKEKELDAVISSLSTVELDLNGYVLQANSIFLGITGYALSDIQGKLYKNLIPQNGNDPIQYEVMWNSILSGRCFSGEFRIVNSDGVETWMAGNFTPIVGENGDPYKVMVISLFTTQDKEKLFELQELVNALKTCFPMVEINQDMTFKSANDLFLSEIGIKRLELKKTLPQHVLTNGSYSKLEQFLNSQHDLTDHVDLSISNKNGAIKRFRSTLIKINNVNGQRKKSLLVLRNTL